MRKRKRKGEQCSHVNEFFRHFVFVGFELSIENDNVQHKTVSEALRGSWEI